MKKLVAILLLTSMFAMLTGVRAEFDEDDFSGVFGEDVFESVTEDDEAYYEGEGDFDVTFDDGGYTGEWVSVDALEIEFFLPDGWQEGDTAEDEYFFAENEDGTADLGIVVYDDNFDGGEFTDWAEKNLDPDDYIIGMANAQEVAVIRDSDIGRIMILLPNASGDIIGFSFYRSSESVLSDSFALEIAGTCTDLWV